MKSAEPSPTKEQAPRAPANFVDLLHDAVCVVDADGCFVYVSAAAERIFGYTPAEMIGRRMIELVAPEDRERTLAAASEIMGGVPQPYFENRYVRKDGRLVHIMWSARWSEEDRLRIAVARDITGRRQTEAMHQAVHAISEVAYTAADENEMYRRMHRIIAELVPVDELAVVMRDADAGCFEAVWRDRLERGPTAGDTGYEQALYPRVIECGKPLLLDADALAALESPPPAADPLRCWLGVPLRAQRGAIGVLVLATRTGGARYTDDDVALLDFVSSQIATAIERRQLYARLEHLAQYDELTGLPNRRLLFDRLDMALARARRAGSRVGVLYLDLDHLKRVNDALGHDVGDQLLEAVARRMQACLRAADTVARMSGDEFVVVLEDIRDGDALAQVANKLRVAVTAPLELAGQQLEVTPSIGGALFPDHGDSATALLQHADERMYREKRQRRNS